MAQMKQKPQLKNLKAFALKIPKFLPVIFEHSTKLPTLPKGFLRCQTFHF